MQSQEKIDKNLSLYIGIYCIVTYYKYLYICLVGLVKICHYDFMSLKNKIIVIFFSNFPTQKIYTHIYSFLVLQQSLLLFAIKNKHNVIYFVDITDKYFIQNI